MQIRVTGSQAECEVLQQYFKENLSASMDYSISRLYPNRNSNQYRLYVNVTFRNKDNLKKLKAKK